MLRITHIAYDEHENKYYIRFAGEPFYVMVEKMKAFGRAHAQFKPDYQWPDGREKAWYIDADALETLTDSFFNLRYQMQQAREKYTQGSLWEDDKQTQKEAFKQAQDWAREFEEKARKLREEHARRAEEEVRERLRQEQERIRRERARRTSTYTPARVEDALSVLGLSLPTTKDEVKQAYRKLMLLHHPDKHMLASPDIRKQHEQECKRINAANDVVLQWLPVHS